MNYFYALLLVIFTAIIYCRRENLLETAFIAVNTIFFLVIPIAILFLDLEPQEAYTSRGFDISSFANRSILLCTLLTFSFYVAVLISRLGFRNNRVGLPCSDELKRINFHKIYSLGILLGLLMRFIGGDIIHSSIYTLPWALPSIYGISDHFYQVGVCCLFIDVYINSINRKNISYILLILIFSIFSGSRITLLIPIGVLIILKLANTKNFKSFLLGSVFIFFLVAFIVICIGISRTDELYSELTFQDIFHLLEFRMADFVWPMALIENLDQYPINHNSIWSLTGLWGAFPSVISIPFTENSIYGRDTALMLEMGLGLENMSVPLTLIGEGYYWGAFYGVISIGFISGISIKFIEFVINDLRPIILVITFAQMFRYVYVLPLAAFPELIASATKDLAISILVAYFFNWLIQLKAPINDA